MFAKLASWILNMVTIADYFKISIKIFSVTHNYLLIILYFIPGLPTQVRDAALNVKDDLPRSEVNKEYFAQNMDNEVKDFFNLYKLKTKIIFLNIFKSYKEYFLLQSTIFDII